MLCLQLGFFYKHRPGERVLLSALQSVLQMLFGGLGNFVSSPLLKVALARTDDPAQATAARGHTQGLLS